MKSHRSDQESRDQSERESGMFSVSRKSIIASKSAFPSVQS